MQDCDVRSNLAQRELPPDFAIRQMQIDRAGTPDSTGDPAVCPICSGSLLNTLYRLTAKQVAECFLPRRRNEQRHLRLVEKIESLWQDSACRLVQCRDCRFAFPIPYVGGDMAFYELAYEFPSYPGRRWEYGRAIELLTRSVPQRVLELGAGTGQFIKALLQLPDFSPDRIVATEYSDYSFNVLHGLGVEARCCSVFELAASASNHSAFDAACAFQSIEHMANAMGVILTLKKMVKAGGLIILSVPHGPAIEFNERHLGCLDLPPNHVGRWYRESFEALAKKTGLELTAHEIEPKKLPQLLKDAAQLRVHSVAGSKPRSLAGIAQRIENRSLRRLCSGAVGSLLLLPLLLALWRLNSGHSQLAVLRVPRNQ